MARPKRGRATRQYTYNDLGEVSGLMYFVDANGNHQFDSGESALEQIAYTYYADTSRQSETRTDTLPGNVLQVTTESWKYDGSNEVTQEVFDGYDDSGNALAYTDTYTYDLSGNRLTLNHQDRTTGGTGSAGPTYTLTDKYDLDNRLLEEDDTRGTVTTYGYTGSDQTSKTVTTNGTVTETVQYTYDALGRLTNVLTTQNGTTTSVSYTYDSSDFRVEQMVNGVRTVYLVDPANPTGYAQVIEEGTDTNDNHMLDAGEVQKAYTLGMSVLTQATATQVLHLLTDVHGDVIAALNANTAPTASSIQQRYAYTAYGVDLGLPASPLTDFRYDGQFIDPLTGLSFNRARWYDPSSGRFTSIDPYHGSAGSPLSFNTYLFGNGNPINGADPSGNFSLLELMISISGGESIDTITNAYKATKATGETAKMVVRLAFLTMESAVAVALPLNIISKLFISSYYLYEWALFEKRVQGELGTDKFAFDAPKVVAYIKGLPGGISRLEAYEGDVGKVKPFLPWDKKGERYAATFIPLTGNRGWDSALSTMSLLGGDVIDELISLVLTHDVVAIQSGLVKLGRDAVKLAAGAIGYDGEKREWHHNEVMGFMEWIDQSKNNPAFGGTPHSGGALLWELIHGKAYS